MPTYEYRCPKGHDFENFYRSIGSAPVEVRCPECGEIATRQLSAGGGLLFKGSGFYITDYGKDGKKDQAKQPAKSEGGGTEKSESGAAKPAGAKTGESGSSSSGEAKPAASPSESKSSATGGAKPAAAPASSKPTEKK